MTSPTPATHRHALADEPVVALPTAALIATTMLIPATTAIVWWAVAALAGTTAPVALAGPLGAGVAGLAALASLLAIGPWKTRPLGLWMSFWLAGALVRLLLTPLLAYLIYSAARLDASALGIAVGATYLLTLLSETAVLSGCMRRAVAPPAASDDRRKEGALADAPAGG